MFLGGSGAAKEVYVEAARHLGRELARRGLTLVYGGGRIGLMGVIADAALAAGGQVIGVIPRHLVEREVAHPGLSDLRVVGDMLERKALMAELSDAFLALPGGYGTLDELFEMLTWTQIGTQAKACGVLNVAGYYDPLLAWVDHAVREGLVRPGHRDLLLSGDDVGTLLDDLAAWTLPEMPRLA
ncbi:putative cytokinin riboside 5'-monophosphate phosphoribohydrolase [Deinococcus aetherius]|uniref:Cytokinin riboside 5'-monophosphate phosphoribohydrolase n=1 Tax=Deinococcus aetherius TaxID=200252 RepID=A0ABN6RIB2_9DEIO|nr:putative cytokinin riboside 5'-monophosphate phosphoribohydrolase [Deinococcus aetherius]